MPKKAGNKNGTGDLWADRRFRAVIENSLDVIALINEQGIVIDESPSITRVFGFSTDEMIGHPAMFFAHPEDREGLIWLFGEVLKHPERRYTGEFRHLHKDGSYSWVEGLSVNSLADPEIHAIVFTFRDITARKETVAALEEARRSLRRYANSLEQQVAERTARLQESLHALQAVLYHVAHDLRAPLRAIDGFIALLQERCERLEEPEVNTYCQKSLDAVGRMDALIQDLLDFGKLGHMDLPLENFSLEDAVNSVLARLAPDITFKAARITVGPDLPRVRSHRRVVEQILHNMVDNAMKFVAPGVTPEIWISAELRDGRVRLFVQDNGVGVPAEHRERIFQVFEKLQLGLGSPGTGIGLAIVRFAAERMGGSAGVEPAPGQGSRFWVELPQAQESVQLTGAELQK